ncbi:uncharacterized protein BO97DRAFT_71289 [Aspergillus homomorphus CBS 101889]|uniref:Uncharacterized protein n=1 Tax=Aspergillus homomorphus (strain CBS 101889) TaxID=1450537 RepID=A0A395HW27_ASPHC|nr:hypothetical protein BO97DRAFT_71289 [Aspergillus homomorphus CBS 101889]RAL12121.1 hypothetical protein BO97DRAFT_71289 [Aspergillus homomorphus CBS 101889]
MGLRFSPPLLPFFVFSRPVAVTVEFVLCLLIVPVLVPRYMWRGAAVKWLLLPPHVEQLHHHCYMVGSLARAAIDTISTKQSMITEGQMLSKEVQ